MRSLPNKKYLQSALCVRRARSFSSALQNLEVEGHLNLPVEDRRAIGGIFARKMPNILEPKWVTGDFGIPLSEFVVDCGNLSDREAVGKRGREAFDKHGIVWFRNSGLTSPDDMASLARMVLKKEMKYEGGSNPRSSIKGAAPNVYEVGAPLTSNLHYHHEMAYIGESTEALAFLAVKTVKPAIRGATYVSNSVKVTDEILKTELGQKLKEHGVCYHRHLTDAREFDQRLEVGVYNHWQRSFETEDPAQAEKVAKAKGLVVDWDGRKMLTRYYQRAFEYFPQMDRNLLYCSIADHGVWFDSWPLVQHLPYAERPLNMTFGDDTPFTRSELRQWADLYDKYGLAVTWETGDVAVICNYRMAHGRKAIDIDPATEKRQLGVLLGPLYKRRGELENKF